MRILLEKPNTAQQASIRTKVIFSIWIIIGALIPYWYHSTKVYRAPLDYDLISKWNSKPLPVHVIHVFLENRQEKEAQIFNELDQLFPSQFVFKDTPNSYRIFYECSPENKVIVGHERLLKIRADCNQDVHIITTLLAGLFVDVNNPKEDDRYAMRTLKYSPNYDLTFNLLVQDPELSIRHWEIERGLEWINPLLNKLENISTFSVASQVQYYAQLPIKGNTFRPKDLTMFVNSEEWNLASVVSTDIPIQLVLYVPSNEIKILDSFGNSETNAFLIPQWGGVVIYNNQSFGTIDANNLKPIMEQFAKQLKSLLGVKPIRVKKAKELLPNIEIVIQDSPIGISDWELDALMRFRITENLKNTISTMNSLSNLLSSLSTIVVQDHISDIIAHSLDHLEKATSTLRDNLVASSLHAREAIQYAELAFFDPTMAPLLYFPGTFE